MKPLKTEPICLISFEITKILLSGEPKDRPGFWKAYRLNLAYNEQTKYNNYRLNVCRRHLVALEPKLSQTWYFRDDRLTTERDIPATVH